MHELKRIKKFPGTLEHAWEFFSSPRNLSRITPDEMDFQITSKQLPEKIYPGMIITYRVKPLLGIPVNWMTEITQVNGPHFFIDEQRLGPYRLWHHQHHFKLVDGGVEMTDIVHYALPFGWLGRILNRLFVAKKLQSIFDYRNDQIESFFGSIDK